VDQPFEEARITPVNLWAQETAAGISYEDIPLNLTESFSWKEETIQAGDSISKFAARYSLLQGSIIALNKMENAWDIKIGAKIKIPNMDGIPYTVQKNDSISRIAEKMKVPQTAILDANDLLSDTIQPGDTLFIPGARMDAAEFDRAVNRNAIAKPMIFPVGGRITSGYGWREDPVRPVSGEKRFHKAVDLAGRIGDPIRAAMQGTVLYIDHNPNLGNFIVLKHGEYQSLYAHLSAYSVKMGETIRQGQEIGKIGNTGYTTGPHLHFEVFHNGNRINPLELMK
jgi:murein DD-endopeptidase MepM/ murein hydrolase activator NlpD